MFNLVHCHIPPLPAHLPINQKNITCSILHSIFLLSGSVHLASAACVGSHRERAHLQIKNSCSPSAVSVGSSYACALLGEQIPQLEPARQITGPAYCYHRGGEHYRQRSFEQLFSPLRIDTPPWTDLSNREQGGVSMRGGENSCSNER